MDEPGRDAEQQDASKTGNEDGQADAPATGHVYRRADVHGTAVRESGEADVPGAAVRESGEPDVPIATKESSQPDSPVEMNESGHSDATGAAVMEFVHPDAPGAALKEGAQNSARVVVREVSANDECLSMLIAQLDDYLAGLYPPGEIFGVDFSDPSTSSMVFAVAYLEGRPVGCGGIRSLDGDTAELKRFYVVPDVRRAGKVYRFLEKRAAERGHSRLRLETGEPQFESIGFYRKQGFYEIDRFGEYAECESSYCMEKIISL